ncbi:UPF0203-domain-containing protein [Nadsonia fulvescens var. elongata DSM 6958]|uniref:UPF0203-domain-containing protein n=1 Tax=Nadsonia fulvescens var. elongata DSM 6958 TaxID=857566 RepID=A0A1E3PF78_9ASCO|nr:UPF0203-domain-containing protein [Nadsonia fulvescens var. elongata DSM 6958]
MSASFAPQCTEKKKSYDNCFNEWYNEKFLKGVATVNECEDTWREYEECVQSALAEKGIKKMLDQAEKEAPFKKNGVLTGSEEVSFTKDSKN